MDQLHVNEDVCRGSGRARVRLRVCSFVIVVTIICACPDFKSKKRADISSLLLQAAQRAVQGPKLSARGLTDRTELLNLVAAPAGKRA